MQGDSQHFYKKTHDWAVYLQDLPFILEEFDTNCIPGECLLGRIFYPELVRLIKLCIVEDSRKHLL